LRRIIPEEFKADVRDLRRVKGRYDDILMTIAINRSL
jgi:hypothetical protein